MVGVFVDFLSNGTKSRQKKFRERYEREVWRSIERGGRRPTPTFQLRDEIRDLRKLEAEEDFLERILSSVPCTFVFLAFGSGCAKLMRVWRRAKYQLVTSTVALLVFWVVGAAVFHTLEGL